VKQGIAAPSIRRSLPTVDRKLSRRNGCQAEPPEGHAGPSRQIEDRRCA